MATANIVNSQHLPTAKTIAATRVYLTVGKSDDIDRPTVARIAAHVRKKMRALGLSMNKAADELGVDTSTLSKLLSGQRDPGLSLVLKIHRKLHIDLNLLVGFDPEPMYFSDESLPPSKSGRPRLHPPEPLPPGPHPPRGKSTR